MRTRGGGTHQADRSINAVISVKLRSYIFEGASEGVGTGLGTDRQKGETGCGVEKNQEHHG